MDHSRICFYIGLWPCSVHDTTTVIAVSFRKSSESTGRHCLFLHANRGNEILCHNSNPTLFGDNLSKTHSLGDLHSSNSLSRWLSTRQRPGEKVSVQKYVQLKRILDSFSTFAVRKKATNFWTNTPCTEWKRPSTKVSSETYDKDRLWEGS